MTPRPWALLLLASAVGCGPGGGTPPTPPPAAAPRPADAPILLEDATTSSGIDFVHRDGSNGRYHLPEAMTGGLVLFDFDADDRIDIFFTGGTPLPPAVDLGSASCGLYRNEGGFRFRNVTAAAGVGHPGFALGAAAADYDADGDQDLYVTALGTNVLFANNGDGTFHDVTEAAGVPGAGAVGAGCAFLDADTDGVLDLYAASYIDFDPDRTVERTIEGHRVYPSPLDHAGAPDRFYLGRGDGTFTDATEASGIAPHVGRGMGVIAADYDRDGDSDVFVLNDAMANFLFENDGRARFTEVAVLRGLAFDGGGQARGNMGVDVADTTGRGTTDFFVTTFSSEPPVLYRDGGGFWEDATAAAGAAAGLVPHMKWGTGFADFDNDGHVDLFVATGDFNAEIARWFPATALRVRNVLLRNLGGGRFADTSAIAGSGLDVAASSRGVGLDDLDGDGRVDVVVLNWRERPTVIRNESPEPGHWLGLRLVGTTAVRDGIGAEVLVTVDGTTRRFEVHAGRGYQSHFGSRLHVGLGAAVRVERVEVRWPGGATQRLEDPPIDRTLLVRQSTGG